MLGDPISTGVAWMVDPHLMVLGVLVAGWVLDKLFVLVEWLRGSRAADGRRPAGAE